MVQDKDRPVRAAKIGQEDSLLLKETHSVKEEIMVQDKDRPVRAGKIGQEDSSLLKERRNNGTR